MFSLDLSKASKLKYLEFQRGELNVRWITTRLRTVKSKSLQCVCINPDVDIPGEIGEGFHQEWQDLDRLLVQFWTTHSIRPRVVYVPTNGEEDMGDRVLGLLPELTKRGLVDLVQATE